jgi:hypothetical protein
LLQHAAACAKVLEAATDLAGVAAGQTGEQAERRGHGCLDPLPQQPRQHRRRASGRDRDGHRVAVNDRRHDEAAQLRPIDDADRDATRSGRCGQSQQVGLGRVGTDRQRTAVEIGGVEYWTQANRGAGPPQHLRLALGDLASTQHQDRAGGQVHEDGKVTHQNFSPFL